VTVAPVRVYEVRVDDFPPSRYSARSRSKARYQAWLDFSDTWGGSFKDFARMTRVRLSADPTPPRRALIAGRPGTIAEGSNRHRVQFIYDGSDAVNYTHPSEVKPLVDEAQA
jgi:hypothetical protein